MEQHHRHSRSIRWGFLLVGLGASLLVTNFTGLWLVRHIGAVGALVLTSWPLIFIVAGIAAVVHGIARVHTTTAIHDRTTAAAVREP